MVRMAILGIDYKLIRWFMVTFNHLLIYLKGQLYVAKHGVGPVQLIQPSMQGEHINEST